MLLRRGDPRTLMAAGQLSLVIGLIGQRFVHPPSQSWQGSVMGLSGVMIGVSVVCNTCGLARWRRDQG